MAASIRSTLRRFETHGWEVWLIPVVVAAAGAVVMGSTGADLVLLRGLVFVGGPLLILSGLHARLADYLHAPSRHRLLALPLAPDDHWVTAQRVHRRGLAMTGAVGALAIGGAALGSGTDLVPAAGLVGDWLWLWLMSVLVEPLIPAAGARLGQRFDEERTEHAVLERLGGGFTIPEAVVHLYAPGLVVGLAAALAMPGQLWLDRSIDGIASPPGLAIGALVALAMALGGCLWARRGYAQGFFGSVPWLHEAIRTLAGPPVPEPVPTWSLLGRDPVGHLLVRQLWRTTAVPGLRLFAMLGGTTWIALAASPSVAALATVLALVAVWLVPSMRIRALAPGRARLCAPLPLPPAGRAGRSWVLWAVVLAPVAGSMTLLTVLWSMNA
ncbi:MAG: hypothetical protein AAF799_31930 [Myxococcota bacterium]